MHDLQRRHVSPPHELLKVFQPDFSANLVRDLHVKRRVIMIRMGVERRLGGAILNRRGLVFVWYRLAKLAVVTQRQSFLQRRIPEITERWFVYVAAVIRG